MHRSKITKGLYTDYYDVLYVCLNCSNEFVKYFNKGEPAEEKPACPKCGMNKTAKKR